ncbi:MAG: hypothetical protein ABJB47_01715 [Actinomycetota bacterium]
MSMDPGGDELAELHEQVVAAPHADRPRLAYAAAVEATDPERAEFIRLQVEINRVSRGQADPLAGMSSRGERASQLQQARGEEWARDIDQLVTEWSFMRGFVGCAKIDAARFLTVAPELYRRAPVVHLILTGVQPVASELFASPHLGRIRSLSINGSWFRDVSTGYVVWEQIGDDEVRSLAQSPHLAELEWLQMYNNLITEAGLDALAASPNLPRLGYLDFSGNKADDPTPRFADDYDYTCAAAEELQRRYGHREWLDARVRAHWPPSRDETWYL